MYWQRQIFHMGLAWLCKIKVGKNESVDWDFLSLQSSQSTPYYGVSRLKSDDSIVNGVSRSDLSRLTLVGLPTLVRNEDP